MNDAEMDSMAQRILSRMHDTGIGQAELARRLKVTPTTIRRLTSDKPPRSFRKMDELAEELGVTVPWLKRGVGPTAPPPAPFKRIPILGQASRDGDEILWNDAAPQGWTEAAPWLSDPESAFSCYVFTNCMSPRLFFGQRVQASWGHMEEIRRGDLVVVITHDDTALIREFAGLHDTSVMLKTYSPENVEEYAIRRLSGAARIEAIST